MNKLLSTVVILSVATLMGCSQIKPLAEIPGFGINPTEQAVYDGYNCDKLNAELSRQVKWRDQNYNLYVSLEKERENNILAGALIAGLTGAIAADQAQQGSHKTAATTAVVGSGIAAGVADQNAGEAKTPQQEVQLAKGRIDYLEFEIYNRGC